MYVCMYVCMYACMYVCKRPQQHISEHNHKRTSKQGDPKQTNTQTNKQTNKQTHTHTHSQTSKQTIEHATNHTAAESMDNKKKGSDNSVTRWGGHSRGALSTHRPPSARRAGGRCRCRGGSRTRTRPTLAPTAARVHSWSTPGVPL